MHVTGFNPKYPSKDYFATLGTLTSGIAGVESLTPDCNNLCSQTCNREQARIVYCTGPRRAGLMVWFGRSIHLNLLTGETLVVVRLTRPKRLKDDSAHQLQISGFAQKQECFYLFFSFTFLGLKGLVSWAGGEWVGSESPNQIFFFENVFSTQCGRMLLPSSGLNKAGSNVVEPGLGCRTER